MPRLYKFLPSSACLKTKVRHYATFLKTLLPTKQLFGLIACSTKTAISSAAFATRRRLARCVARHRFRWHTRLI